MGHQTSMMKIVLAVAVLAAVACAAPAKPVTLELSPEFLATLANSTHYEDPKPNGCLSDEISIQIQGVKGDFCTPACSLFKPCTSELPSGVTAKAQCALQDASSGKKYCALICSPSTDAAALKVGDAQCGTGSCKPIQGLGVCTYDD